MLLIPMPISTITVSKMHIPPKTHSLSKGSGWGKEIRLWSFEQNESDIKLNSVLNSSAKHAKDFLLFLILGSKHLDL